MKFIGFELRLLWQNRLLKWLLLIYLLASLAAMFWGQAALERAEQQRDISQAHYQSELAEYREQAPLDSYDLGYMGYYQFHPVSQTLSPWSALFGGEQLEQTDHLRIRLLGLQTQLTTTASGNIAARAIGNLDMGFIWLYLLPLLIAVLSINLMAEEKSSGRWPLLAAQVSSSGWLLTQKMAVAGSLLALINVLILLLAVQFTNITLDATWWQVAGLLLAYQFFWFLLAGWIISLQRSAIFNNLLFISVWVLFAFVLPGLAYLSETASQKPGEHVAMVFDQREFMHDSWDRDKQADFDAYLQTHPQWQQTAPVLNEGFDWRWYYAMQQLSDEVVADNVANFRETRLQAHQQGEYFAWLSPVMRMQYSFNRLADTDMLANQAFLDQLTDYHQQLRTFFYSFYFADKTFTGKDFESIPAFEYQPVSTKTSLKALINLLLWAGFLAGLIVMQNRRHQED